MNRDLLKLFLPEPSEQEIRELCRAKKEELGFDIEKSTFPLNPLSIEPTISIEEAVKLLELWDSVLDSVLDSLGVSVGESVRKSVWESVGDSVWDSVGDYVWDYVWESAGGLMLAYTSSIFYGVESWHGVEHEKGVNPFQAGIDLWESGYIAAFDGKSWHLMCGKDAKVVWTGSFNDE